MFASFTRPRLLPGAIAAMALLLVLKSVALVQVAMAAGAAPAAAAAAPEKPSAAAPEKPAPHAADAAAAPAKGGEAPPGADDKPAKVLDAEAVPAVTDGERALLLDLRHRRAALEARARDLDQRDAVIAAAEKKLAARVAELGALQARLEAMEAARVQHDAANWTGLVHVYETMKPRDAAAIFDALDMQVLLGVLDRMSERKAAPILAAMQPDRARLATQMLAEMRTRAVTPTGENPPQNHPDPKG